MVQSSSRADNSIEVRRLGRVDFEPTWRAMMEFTARRDDDTVDELWLLEHPAVYTLGQAGRREHLLFDNGIALIKTDRGGQITYHGPGQPVVYLLVDLVRRKMKVHELVTCIEQAVIDLLAEGGVSARRLPRAPGVYVGSDCRPEKIAALGLRIRKGRCYHGVCLNVDMDLAPYSAINPCGYAGMAVTQTRDQGMVASVAEVGEALVMHLRRQLEGPV